jgi:hypothetical protein
VNITFLRAVIPVIDMMQMLSSVDAICIKCLVEATNISLNAAGIGVIIAVGVGGLVCLMLGGCSYNDSDFSGFRSMDEAAIDFAETTNGKSIRNDWEYGSFIYSYEENGRTRYDYTTPHTNQKNYEICFKNVEDICDECFISKPKLPNGATLVALAHTHGAWKPQKPNSNTCVDSFSAQDNTLIHNWKIPVYLASPNGSLQKQTPGKVGFWPPDEVVKAWRLPHDRNHHDLPNSHKDDCSNCV